MGVTYLEPGSSQMGHKESIADTARVLGEDFMMELNIEVFLKKLLKN